MNDARTNIAEYTGILVVVRCWCGIQHAVPESLHIEQRRKHDDGGSLSIYCPRGHTYVPAGQSKAQILERQLTTERARHDQTREALKHAEASRRAEKAAKTKIRRRVANGVCPCCQRTFKDLAAHMKTKHPTFAAEE